MDVAQRYVEEVVKVRRAPDAPDTVPIANRASRFSVVKGACRAQDRFWAVGAQTGANKLSFPKRWQYSNGS